MVEKSKLITLYGLLSLLITILILIVLLTYKGKILEFRPMEERSFSNVRYNGTCTVPEGGFRSWLRLLVTTLKPEIKTDCKRLFDGDMSEVKRLESAKLHWKNTLNDSDLLEATANCSFVKEYFNNNFYTTRLEYSFPIAFVFAIYNSPQQVVRLLRLLYRPHNQYCVHPDSKSSPSFINIFKNIAGCLDNVHIASKLQNVQWLTASVMESIMNCYQDLIKIREGQQEQEKWKYIINLCGKELPLKSNHEIVSQLIPLNGTSMLSAGLIGANDRGSRWRLPKKPIPHSIPFAKSNAYNALSSDFVKFLFTNRTAIELYEYFKNVAVADEHYFATVYMMPKVPGGFNPNLSKEYLFTTSRSLWDSRYSKYPEEQKKRSNCHGKIVHYVCIVDIGDLRWITKSPERALFQNKYLMENDHLVMDCMEKRVVSQNQLEYMKDCQT